MCACVYVYVCLCVWLCLFVFILYSLTLINPKPLTGWVYVYTWMHVPWTHKQYSCCLSVKLYVSDELVSHHKCGQRTRRSYHLVSKRKKDNNFLKCFSFFNIFLFFFLLPVSQDLDRLGLKASQASFKNRYSYLKAFWGAVGSSGNLHTEFNTGESALLSAGTTSPSFAPPTYIPKLFCKPYKAYGL